MNKNEMKVEILKQQKLTTKLLKLNWTENTKVKINIKINKTKPKNV